MTDYSKGVIYIIRSLNTEIDKVYIGSTCDFRKRMWGHKTRCNNKDGKCHYKIYNYIRENNGWDNFEMIVLEDYPCNNRYDLERRESEVIREYGENVLNEKLPTRSNKEWYEDNKEEHALRMKEYRENNKEEIALRKKEYYEDNKEYLALRVKEYYQANKETIALKKNEKRECICGASYIVKHKARHYKTKKHISFIECL